MTTTCVIAIQGKDGAMKAISCLWYGYSQHLLDVLQAYHSSKGKAEELIALGNLSWLGPKIGKAHSFEYYSPNDPKSKWTVAYSRDRGDTFEPPLQYKSLDELTRAIRTLGFGVSFLCVFRAGRWEEVKLRLEV